MAVNVNNKNLTAHTHKRTCKTFARINRIIKKIKLAHSHSGSHLRVDVVSVRVTEEVAHEGPNEGLLLQRELCGDCPLFSSRQ